jgi:outer membrane protein TolC
LGSISLAYAKPIHLNDCVDSALKNSQLLAALRANVQAADSAYARDRSSLGPTLALADEASYSTFGPEATFSNGSENRANAELSMDLQRLLAPPSALSRLDLQRNQMLLIQAQGQLRRDVTQAYSKVLILLRKSAEQAQAKDFVDSHIRDIERLQSSGLDVALDLLRAKSQSKSLDLSALNQSGDLDDTLATLRSLTGLTLSATDFDVEGDLALVSSTIPADGPAALSEKILQTVQAKLTALDLQSAQAAAQGSGRFSAPSLRLGLDHSFLAIDPNAPLDRVYGGLSFNAFDWGQQGHATDQLHLQLKAQEQASAEQERAQRLYANQVLSDLKHAAQAYALSASLVQDAQQGLEIAKVYYRQGKAKESDLLSVFADYLAAIDQRDESLLSLLNKKAEWDAIWDGSQP